MPKAPVAHSKTFTGCWTCRARHVKCDERRPQCARCQKSHVACEGYGIRLVWNHSDKGTSRPSLDGVFCGSAQTSVLAERDLSAAIQATDEKIPEHQSATYSNGPFSVFSVNGSTEACSHHSQCLCAAAHCPSLPPYASTPSGDQPTSNFIPPEIAEFISPVFHDLDELDQPSHADSGSEIRSAEARPLTPEPLASLSVLTSPSSDLLLLHHWITFICPNLMPVDSPENLFRNILTPMAVHPSRTESSGQTALYHAICAGAAYSRARQYQEPSSCLAVAARHEHLALRHLQKSLGAVTIHQKEAVLATIMACAVTEIIRGRTPSSWRQHMMGGLSWIETFGTPSWGAGFASSVLYQQFQAAAVFGALQHPDSDMYAGLHASVADDRDYCLDKSFGLPRQLFDVLRSLNRMCRCAAESTAEEIDAFELMLYLSVPSSGWILPGTCDEPSRTAILHMAHVFYYAILIHFKRRVRRTAPRELQDLVCKCIEHLEAIEEIPKIVLGGPVAWPCLVAACEANSFALKERYMSWFQRKARHGFGTVEVVEKLVLEVWRRREFCGCDEDVHWMDVMREMGWDILLC